MKLVKLRLSNFRCYKDTTTVEIDNLTVFIGRNDSGKSSLLDALDIFFNDKAAPDKDDACVHGSDSVVRIACVFDDLPSDLVIDTQHPTDLASEHLLNPDGHLEIVKVYDCNRTKPICTGVFACAEHPTAEKYTDLLSLTNSKLKKLAVDLGVNLSTVNQTVNADLRRAIWGHANDLELQDTNVPLKLEAAKAIWEQLKRSLPIFALFRSDRPSTDQDAEAQDPMKVAIKEAIKVQIDILEAVTKKVTSEVQKIANSTIDKIRDMDPALASQLTPRVTAKKWDTLFSVSLTGDEDIPVNKRGSGTRRLILLNFFRAQAERAAGGDGLEIIYAIEEPETSQHPHNQSMLVKALRDLSETPGCQVLLTTHTPVLARRFNQSALRLITTNSDPANRGPLIQAGDNDATLNKMAGSLGVFPDHDILAFWGVEGKHDIEFLRTISKILHDSGEDLPDVGEAEDAGHLVFIPLGGSALELWVFRLAGLKKQEFYLMDRDTEPPDNPRYHEIEARFAQRENCTPWTTGRRELENYIHHNVIKDVYPNYTGTGRPFENVPRLLAQTIHEESGNESTWDEVLSDPRKLSKKVSNAKHRLNGELVKQMTPDLLSEIDRADEVRTWLKAVGKALQGTTEGAGTA